MQMVNELTIADGHKREETLKKTVGEIDESQGDRTLEEKISFVLWRFGEEEEPVSTEGG